MKRMLVTISEAGELYGTSPPLLRKWRDEGKLKPVSHRYGRCGPSSRTPVPLYDPMDIIRLVVAEKGAMPRPKNIVQEEHFALLRHQQIEQHWKMAG